MPKSIRVGVLNILIIMKKSILVLMALSAMIACQKDEPVQENPVHTLKSSSTYENYEAPSNIEEALSEFVADHANGVTLGDRPINEVVWYVEGAANYANRYIDNLGYEDVDIFTFESTYDLVDGNVSAIDIADFYGVVTTEIGELEDDFIASNVFVSDISGTSVTFTTEIIEAVLPYLLNLSTLPENFTERKSISALDCAQPTPNAAIPAYEIIGTLAMNKYKNSVNWSNTRYTYYTTVITYGVGLGTSMGIDDNTLWGQGLAIFDGTGGNPNHRASTYPGDCISATQGNAYKDDLLRIVNALGNPVPSLTKGVVNLELDYETNGFSGAATYQWFIRRARIGSQGKTFSAP
jgi:hypothetical protein